MGLWPPPGPCAHPGDRGLPSSTWDTLGHRRLHTDVSTHGRSHAHAYTLTSAHVPTPTCRCLHSLLMIMCFHTRMHMYMHTHPPHVRTHAPHRHKEHPHIHMFRAGSHAHPYSHTPLTPRGERQRCRQSPRSEAHCDLPRGQDPSLLSEPASGGPGSPASLRFSCCLGLPLGCPQALLSVLGPACGLNFLLPLRPAAALLFTSASTI